MPRILKWPTMDVHRPWGGRRHGKKKDSGRLGKGKRTERSCYEDGQAFQDIRKETVEEEREERHSVWKK